MALLIAIRDALIVAALAWVGVTLESNVERQSCTGEACQTQSER